MDNIRVIIVVRKVSGNNSGLLGISHGIKNVYKSLMYNKLIDRIPVQPSLDNWTKQGIYILSVSQSDEEMASRIVKDNSDKIFILWGTYANSLIDLITGPVFSYVHPNIHEREEKDISFIKCDNFTKVNEILDIPINWSLEKYFTIYTDGACAGNGSSIAVAGYSIYFKDEKKVIYARVPIANVGGQVTYPSNQRAEGIAILEALKYSKDHGIGNMLIVTDSQFWIDMIYKYMPSWNKKNIDFKEKKNSDITTELYNLITPDIQIIHVPSHGKGHNVPIEHIEGNDIADKYAVKARYLNHYEVCNIYI